jgi:hypothetical protein
MRAVVPTHHSMVGCAESVLEGWGGPFFTSTGVPIFCVSSVMMTRAQRARGDWRGARRGAHAVAELWTGM